MVPLPALAVNAYRPSFEVTSQHAAPCPVCTGTPFALSVPSSPTA